MDHACVVDTARGERLCLGRCAYKYREIADQTTTIHLIAGDKNNAYDVVSRYANAAAGKSATARFAGSVLHGLIEEAVILKAAFKLYPPLSATRVFDRGLTMWIKNDAALAADLIGNVADDIIAFAVEQTGLSADKLVFYAEAPVVVSVNAKGESWPRFADLVVASAATRKTLLIIDLFFSESAVDIQALCRTKLRGLRYIKSKPVRDTFNVTGIKVAVLLWIKPNLFNMASIVMSGRPTKKRLTDETFLVMGSPVPALSGAAIGKSRGLASDFLAKMRAAGATEMLVRLKKPSIQMLGSSWFKYESVVARITDKQKMLIKILTPTFERTRLLTDALFGGRWVAAAIEELDSGVFATTDFTPVFIGKTLDKNSKEEKKIDRHEEN